MMTDQRKGYYEQNQMHLVLVGRCCMTAVAQVRYIIVKNQTA